MKTLNSIINPINNIGTVTRIKTDSYEEWKELRNHYIGGSDAASVAGMNPYKGPGNTVGRKDRKDRSV